MWLFLMLFSFNVIAQTSNKTYSDNDVLSEQELNNFYDEFKNTFFKSMKKGFLDKGLTETMASDLVNRYESKFDYDNFRAETKECYKNDTRFSVVNDCMKRYIKRMVLFNK